MAYSNAEFRWSSRLRREDGLMRLVPGLGTRAVDRLSDDYPVLLAPGQPRLRVNQSVDEIVRYSPRKADVVNLETNRFETVDLPALIREHGQAYPALRHLVVEVRDHDTRRPVGMVLDVAHADLAVTNSSTPITLKL